MSFLRTSTSSLLRATTSASASASYSTAAPAAARVTVSHSTSNASSALLGNIEASWKNLPKTEQEEVYKTLEEVQKRDWKVLNVDEKKAAYFVAYGPHGPRTPTNSPGNSMRVAIGTVLAISTAFGIFSFARTKAAPLPRTMTKEYQEAANELAKENNINPITGVSSEGYKGKGFVTVA